MKRLLIAFSCCLWLSGVSLLAQVDITRMWFTPAVMPENYAEPVRFEAKVVGAPASVAFEYNLVDRPMFDDGTHGDRLPGDGIWTILFQPGEITGKLTAQWVHRPFIGFCKPAGAGRYNIFAQIWTAEMGLVDSRQMDVGGQSTGNIVNFTATTEQLMNLDASFWAKRFYESYGDEFDFINFVLVEGRRENRYHVLIKNDILGIGLPAFDNSSNFGSHGRLKGYNYFPISGFFDTASVGFNHETGHQWMNFLQGAPFSSGVPHWPKGNIAINTMGFSMPPLGVGGTYSYTFVPNPGGSYSVGPGDTRNTTYFNTMELYLMGLIPPEEVGSFFVLKDQNRDLVQGSTLQLSEIIPVTAADIIKAAGSRRIPDSVASQKAFRAATIVLSEQFLDPYALAFFDWFASRAEAKEQLSCSEGFLTYKCNPFLVATGGRASMSTGLPGVKSIKLTLAGGGVAASRTVALDTVTKAGYATLVLDSGTAPYGTAVFKFKQNGVTVTEVGVPAFSPTTQARIFIDHRAAVKAVAGKSGSGTVDVNTGIALVNVGIATAHVAYALRDLDGVLMAAGHGTVDAGAHIACFIDDLQSTAAPDFNLPADFENTRGFGSLDISADRPLAVLALRGIMNQRSEFLLTTTPVADLAEPAVDGSVYFPQFVDGGGYTTSIVLLNSSGSIQTGELEILDKDGNPMTVNRVGGTADSTFKYAIQPGGFFRFQTDGFPAQIKSGWARVTPDAGSSTPAGSGIFGFNPEDVLISESGIPSAAAMTRARIYIDLSGKHNTGLAMANLSGTESGITIRAFEKDGVTAAGSSRQPLRLPAYGYESAFADQLVSGLPEGFAGVLEISSMNPFSILTVRSLVNERDEFLMTAFPVADANRAAPSPVVFPHLADGGGYSTEFILISPVGGAKTTLLLYDEKGLPLSVGE